MVVYVCACMHACMRVMIDTLPLLPPHLDLDMSPTEEELMQALTKLKIRKAE